ncbi:MAG TPA: sensor domain-containing protein [Pseudonocardiaceae bacterium]|nr:sensor domain-containing protein [Pseudonocardiaceae bacterium]
MSQVAVVVRRVLREPVSTRPLSELAYVLLAAPVTVLGVLYVIVSLAVGVALAVTAIGIPLISWAVPGTRGFTAFRRHRAAGLLGERIPDPPPFRPPPGLLSRVSAGLRDSVGWRSVRYLLVTLLLDVVGLYVVLVTWAWGLIALTYPIQFALGVNQSTIVVDGQVHRGLIVHGIVADTWPAVLLVSVAGVALLLLAPWAVRVFLLADRLLMRRMLGRAGAAARIRDLERSRAYAIEDVAATVRRIERDLHDGVQARMVALAMNLTMLNETLGPDVSEQSRNLLTAALDHAKDGIGELRHMVSGIHPPALDAGLETALGTLAARSPIPVDVRAELPERPTEAIETIAYFSVAELLTNVSKHSGADRATVELTETEGRLVLRVCDEGRGGANLDNGTGLRGLTERVGTVDGRLAVDSPVGGPTVITIELPLHT